MGYVDRRKKQGHVDTPSTSVVIILKWSICFKVSQFIYSLCKISFILTRYSPRSLYVIGTYLYSHKLNYKDYVTWSILTVSRAES